MRFSNAKEKTMENYFNQTPKQVFDRFHLTEQGLSSDDVIKRQKKYGPNVLTEKKEKSLFTVFLEQFKDLIVVILIIAAIISSFSGSLESAIVIIAVLILNAVLGTIQHFKAKKSLESLKALSSPNAKVIRDGEVKQIPSKDVVPGDIVLQEAGDLIVADGRIIENYSLQVNESSLTGESENMNKTSDTLEQTQLPLGDQTNMVFSGSFVTYGHAKVVVTATGMNTEIGKIATLMNQTKEKRTPLQMSLDNFSKRLAIGIIMICLIVFFLEWWRAPGQPIDALLFAVALAVAAIPEALSSIVTIVQAIGTQKMVKEHAIMKELKAVETLGCVSVICSDKTGTLTQNKMSVKNIYCNEKLFDYEQLNPSSPTHNMLLHIAALTNDSIIHHTEEKGEQELGDPTEIALVALVNHFQIEETEIRQTFPRIAEIPFDSDRKLMSTVHMLKDKTVLFTKGALDVLLPRLCNILTDDGIREITQQDRDNIANANQQLSENGLRVLAFAYKNLSSAKPLSVEDENQYTFIGLVSMIDPPREETMQAVSDAHRAGIRTIMITGDHKVTAAAIARQVGIMHDGDSAITGIELSEMSDSQLQDAIENISVYARVSPEHKIRIVDAWQKQGRIVAMTGDGVNDAPALKKANIGVAMGITGTEVSKDAASMILTDDNFATIVKSVQNGRNVYNNIKNSIRFLLSGNAAAILAVVYTAILPGLTQPFTAVQLLFINLLTDSLPAIAIGMENSQDDLLSQPPRDPKKSILDRHTLSAIGIQGVLIAICTMISYYIGNAANPAMATTMAFCTLTLARLFHGFNCRGSKDIFHLGLFSNQYSILAFCAGVALLALAMFVPPIMHIFNVEPMAFSQILWIILTAFIPTFLIQSYKVIRHWFGNSRAND